MNEFKVKMFGAFRKYVPSGEILIRTPQNISAHQTKALIAEEIRRLAPGFNDSDLLKDSALGNAEGVFAEDQVVPYGLHNNTLALLPPVCGG